MMRLIISVLFFNFITITGLIAQTTNTNDDSIVADVNGEKIYKSAIDTIISDFSKSGRDIDKKTKKLLIDRLIEQKIVAQFAKKQGYDKNTKVQQQIQVMTEMVLHDNYFSDLIKKNITPESIKSEFDKRTKNLTDSFEYKASHILVKSHQKAIDIKKQLDNKSSFKALAQKYSSDGSAKNGGDLGYFSAEMMVKPFADAVKKLSIGAVSEPVQTDFGWHIIHLTDKRALPKPTLEQLTPNIQNDLTRQFMMNHIKMLKKQSDIKIYP